MKYFITLLSLCLAGFITRAQEKPLDMKMDFEQYDPPSTLKVEEHKLKNPSSLLSIYTITMAT